MIPEPHGIGIAEAAVHRLVVVGTKLAQAQP
jgi:hypothetical protein